MRSFLVRLHRQNANTRQHIVTVLRIFAFHVHRRFLGHLDYGSGFVLLANYAKGCGMQDAPEETTETKEKKYTCFKEESLEIVHSASWNHPKLKMGRKRTLKICPK